jgi:hypothetical protein
MRSLNAPALHSRAAAAADTLVLPPRQALIAEYRRASSAIFTAERRAWRDLLDGFELDLVGIDLAVIAGAGVAEDRLCAEEAAGRAALMRAEARSFLEGVQEAGVRALTRAAETVSRIAIVDLMVASWQMAMVSGAHGGDGRHASPEVDEGAPLQVITDDYDGETAGPTPTLTPRPPAAPRPVSAPRTPASRALSPAPPPALSDGAVPRPPAARVDAVPPPPTNVASPEGPPQASRPSRLESSQAPSQPQPAAVTLNQPSPAALALSWSHAQPSELSDAGAAPMVALSTPTGSDAARTPLAMESAPSFHVMPLAHSRLPPPDVSQLVRPSPVLALSDYDDATVPDGAAQAADLLHKQHYRSELFDPRACLHPTAAKKSSRVRLTAIAEAREEVERERSASRRPAVLAPSSFLAPSPILPEGSSRVEEANYARPNTEVRHQLKARRSSSKRKLRTLSIATTLTRSTATCRRPTLADEDDGGDA